MESRLLILIILFSILALYNIQSAKANKKSSSYSEFTPEEKLKLKQLRQYLEQIKGYDYYESPLKTDAFLIHVMRARDGDVKKSLDLVKEIMEWRLQNGIDSILEEDFSKFRKKYPYWMDDGSYSGNPIVTIPVWDIRKIVLSGQLDYVIRYIDYIFEEGIVHALNASKILGKEITQGIAIVDLSMYSPRTHACLACMGFYTEFFRHWETYYPQSASHVFLLNTPRLFTHLLSLLRPLMSPYTRANTHVYGVNKQEYLKHLLKLIPIEKIRVQFGGKRKN